jgi:hypothetical protein
MTNLETREIRGVTWKLICTVVMTAIAGIAFTFSGYNKILQAINESSKTNAIHEIQIKSLEIRVDKLQLDVDKLKEEIKQRQ